MKEDPKSAWVEFKVAIAGPIASFLLAGLFYGAAQTELGGPSVTAVTSYLALVNLILGAFNLVPAFPLDGGRVLRAVIWNFTNKVRATQISSGIGTFFAYLLMVNGVLGLVMGAEDLTSSWTVSMSSIIVPVYSTAYARSTFVEHGFRRARNALAFVTRSRQECSAIS